MDSSAAPEAGSSAARDRERELLAQRAARYAKRTDLEVERRVDLVSFQRGATRYAIAIESLREIRPMRHLCRIPGASDAVPGVTHVRAEILSVHDLAAYMGHGAAAEGPWILVVEHGDARLGLMADDVFGIESVAPTQIRPAPITLGDRAAVLLGIARDCSVLDPAALFNNERFYRAF
jgi:chemotaxis signal transduction protein